MKIIKASLAIFLLMTLESHAVSIKGKSENHNSYKSDEFDDLLEGVITNNHKPQEAEKLKGPVDTMVDEAMVQAAAQVKADQSEKQKEFKPVTQEEQWKKLMEQPDPLQDQDIYAGEIKE